DLTGLVHTSGHHVVFTGGENELFALDIDSGEVHDLNPGREQIATTLPSPDGRSLLFSAADPTRNGGLFLVRFTDDGFVPARPVAGFEHIPAVHAGRLRTDPNQLAWSAYIDDEGQTQRLWPDRRFVAIERGMTPGELGIDVVDTWANKRHFTIGARPDVTAVSLSFGWHGAQFTYSVTDASGRRDGYAYLSAGGRTAGVELGPDGRILPFSRQDEYLIYVDATDPGGLRVVKHNAVNGEETAFDVAVPDEQLLDVPGVSFPGGPPLGLFRNGLGNRVLRLLGSQPPSLLSDPARDLDRYVRSFYGDGPFVFFYTSPAGLRITAKIGSIELVLEGADAEMAKFDLLSVPTYTLGNTLSALVEDNEFLAGGLKLWVLELGDRGPYDCFENNLHASDPTGSWDPYAVLVQHDRKGLQHVGLGPKGAFADEPMASEHGGTLSCPIWSPEKSALAYVEDSGRRRRIYVARDMFMPEPVEVYSTTAPIRSIELVVP
ncbi:MAG TPA: hypothetical protein VK509_12335, partial [Polyangiales bacterium]|nr:hypothetical protein [Polyangiales bacterium]